MILEDSEEGRFVANVGNVFIVKIVQALDKAGGATQHGDESCHVMGNEALEYQSALVNRGNSGENIQLVFPDTGLECLPSSILERANTSAVVDIRALERILKSPSLIQIFGLEESREPSVCPVHEGLLIGLEQILPSLGPFLILLCVASFLHTPGHLRNSKVVVRVLKGA